MITVIATVLTTVTATATARAIADVDDYLIALLFATEW